MFGAQADRNLSWRRSGSVTFKSTTNMKSADEYSKYATSAGKLLSQARPAIESRKEAFDVRAVDMGLRDLDKALQRRNLKSASSNVSKMRVPLERVKALAQAAPQRTAKRENEARERQRKMDRLQVEINMLTHHIEAGSTPSSLPGRARGPQTLAELEYVTIQAQQIKQFSKQRDKLRRDLRKLQQAEQREANLHQQLQRDSRI